MLVLPSGLAFPPIQHLIGVLGATLLVVALLWAIEPPVDQRLVLALAPWMAVGGALHAFHQLGFYPAVWAPLFGAPTVYLSTFVVTGVVWTVLAVTGVARGTTRKVTRNLGLTGVAVLTVLFVVAVYRALGRGTLDLVWPSVAAVVALVATVLLVLAISLWRTPVFVRTRYAGPTVVFAHALDGVSTAVGADVLGVAERTPLPRAIMDFAGDLPTADLLGVGWLFVAVKLAVAAVVVVAFNRYLDEEPVEGSVLLAVVAAVGLGPAANNLVLFLVAAP